jgi:hypothetical protein
VGKQSEALVPYRSGAQRGRFEWKKSKHGLKLVRWVYNRHRQKKQTEILAQPLILRKDVQTDENRGEQPAKGGSLESEWVPENEVIPFFRWSARVLGVIVAGFSLFIGETFFGTRHAPSPPIEPGALVGLILGGGYVIGMFLALRWERAGAILGGASLGLLVIGLLGSGFHGAGDPTLTALWGGILGLVFFLPVVLYITLLVARTSGPETIQGGIIEPINSAALSTAAEPRKITLLPTLLA